MKIYLFTIPLFLLLIFINSCNTKYVHYDIAVYGGTSAGIVAAIQASRMGKKVIIIEPGTRLGGLTTGGLGQTDIGNKQAIGGIAREFYQNIRKYYNDTVNWEWQKSSQYRSRGQAKAGDNEDAMWTFEPSAALEVFQDMIAKEKHINVVYNQRLNRENGVRMEGNRITSITMESGEIYSAKIFIDATYEGDLMATSGVSYTTGRESAEQYGESLNGVQTKMAKYHQFPDGIDPYIVKGDTASGMLPNINITPGIEGIGDNKIQAYCFRMCLTDAPENRITIEKPGQYNEQEYELLFRAIEAGYNGPFFIMSDMPNRKTDSNNKGPLSSDYIGKNYAYPEADYETRDKIIKEHEIYQKGLLWTLSNHPRIPEDIRRYFSKWGLPKDEFRDNGHWSPQLYIREARRMVSDYVMTQHNCTSDSIAGQSIGMGAYNMDSHHTQRYIDKKGFVKNEGDVEVKIPSPYPVSYRAITPKASECKNLLVPVCLSASHIAYGSIRMEPVFMVLGQSAAVAASIAIYKGCAVQEVPYEELKINLLKKGQILHVTKANFKE